MVPAQAAVTSAPHSQLILPLVRAVFLIGACPRARDVDKEITIELALKCLNYARPQFKIILL